MRKKIEVPVHISQETSITFFLYRGTPEHNFVGILTKVIWFCTYNSQKLLLNLLRSQDRDFRFNSRIQYVLNSKFTNKFTRQRVNVNVSDFRIYAANLSCCEIFRDRIYARSKCPEIKKKKGFTVIMRREKKRNKFWE